MTTKKSLEFEGMVKYLNTNKNIQFNIINELVAKTMLTVYGYNNVIAPFKFRFADKDPEKKNKLLVLNGSHVYSKPTEFVEWFSLYNEERMKYPKMYKNIVLIKTAYKNILFNTIFLDGNIHSREDMNLYLAKLNYKYTNSTNATISRDKISNYLNTIKSLMEDLENSYNIYYFVGKAGMGHCNNLFLMQSEKIQKKVIHEMQNLGLCPKPISVVLFNKRMVMIQFVRNCIMHNDSLEVLCRYTYRKDKRFRNSSDRKEYQNLVKYLEFL